MNRSRTSEPREAGRLQTPDEIAALVQNSRCDTFYRQKHRGIGEHPVTVCIAARSSEVVFLVSDRMITSGDIQFEPPSPKVIFLTNSIAIAAAGDSSFHTEIVKDVNREVNERVEQEPLNWWLVKEIVDLYIKYRNFAKVKRSESAILSPLGLDMNTWVTNQKLMDADLVRQIASDLINFSLPSVSVIIAGVDMFRTTPTPHIYTIEDGVISCDDIIGFRAIGSGARHAESQFMLAGHAWNSGLHETAVLAYRAKRDAEVAPGVGAATDMYMFGPRLGQSNIVNLGIQQKMEAEYQKMKSKYREMQAELVKEVTQYVDDLPSPTVEIQATSSGISEAEAPDGSSSAEPSG